MSRLRVILAGVLVSCLAIAGSARALQQEHPKEHPKKEQPAKEQAKEHPKKEHPKKEHPAPKPTTEDLDKAIRAEIAERAKATGGRFQVRDEVLNKTWSLELVRVHKDKLTPLDENTHFACVDFKAEDGTAVDVDFYLKSESGKLRITDTTVHKVNGKARFMYQEKGGYWERVKPSS